MSRIAIIGSGVSGAVAARVLATEHDVTLFESSAAPGGHARTLDVHIDGREHRVDTGFMVYNDRTYPNFCRLLDLLGVESRKSDMSFSVSCRSTGQEYQGSSLNGLFARRSNLLRAAYWGMLRDVLRFNKLATAAVAEGSLDDGRSVDDFLRDARVGRLFVSHYLTPMAAAIWSSDPRSILDFPAKFLIGFFANHGLLQLTDRPQWCVIPGGSRRYVQALILPLGDRIRLDQPVASIARTNAEVLLTPRDKPAESFDQVVFACHADQALRMLRDPTDAEREVLSAFPYLANESVLHTDRSQLPQRPRACASWNYLLPKQQQDSPSVTYDLSRLQGLESREPILLTLNPFEKIDPARVLDRHTFYHPAFSHAAVAAQRRWAEVSGVNRTHYCGAYWGFGFHEDGVASALAVTNTYNLGLEACRAACTKARSRTADALR